MRTEKSLKGFLDKEYYMKRFEETIQNKEQLLIQVPKELRGFGKTTILNEMSTIAQTVFGLEVIVITPYVNQEHIGSEMWTVPDAFSKHKIIDWIQRRTNILIVVDDLNLEDNDSFRIIHDIVCSKIPMIGFVFDTLGELNI